MQEKLTVDDTIILFSGSFLEDISVLSLEYHYYSNDDPVFIF